ncbi:hypothetical protein C0J52_21623 [Blattella germanica]|nr:hypothetical protein C0J52_21623 [Blattella germanica]
MATRSTTIRKYKFKCLHKFNSVPTSFLFHKQVNSGMNPDGEFSTEHAGSTLATKEVHQECFRYHLGLHFVKTDN